MVKLVSVTVAQAEGVTGQLLTGTVGTVAEAEKLLRRIAANGPELGGYKTDVTLRWADDVELRLTHMVQRLGEPANDLDVSAHLRGWATFVTHDSMVAWIKPNVVQLAREILAGEREGAPGA